MVEALKNNPDIRVAAANMALAEAELNRTRLQITQKVVTPYYAIDTQKKFLEHEEVKLNRIATLYKSGQVNQEEIEEARKAFTVSKAKLAELEAEMPGLLGKAQASAETHTRGTTLRVWGAIKIDIPQAEKLRKALQTPVKVDYKDMTFSEVLKDLEKKVPGLSFHIRDLPSEIIGRFHGRATRDEAKVTLHFDMPLPTAAILQAIEDKVGSHFIVRDYGILVTSRTDALPPGGITVQEFMRQKPANK